MTFFEQRSLMHFETLARCVPIIVKCDDDVKLTTYNVLSPKLASQRNFPAVNSQALESRCVFANILLNLHAIGDGKCVFTVSNVVHVLQSNWKHLFVVWHLGFALQELQELSCSVKCIQTRSSLGMLSHLRWPKICDRLQKAADEDRIIALQVPWSRQVWRFAQKLFVAVFESKTRREGARL